MALCLVLRNVNKMQSYSCVLRCTPLALKNFGSVSQLTTRASPAVSQKLAAAALNSKIITTPAARGMGVHSDHRMMWTIERVLSLVLAGLLPLTIAVPNPVLDNLSAVAIVLHLHWGIEAMVEDYVRPIIFGHTIPKISLAAVYIISAVTLGGLLYFNYTDIGLGKAIRKLWAVKSS